MNPQNQKDDRINLRPTRQELNDFPVESMKMDSFWCSLLGEDECESIEYTIY